MAAVPIVPVVKRRKALLIGCNYPGSRAELKGCIKDVHCIEDLLKSKFRFKSKHIVKLCDDTKNPRHMPTKENIFHWMDWLVKGTRAGDSLFFFFSGHGGQEAAKYNDEKDGMDETICPTDFLDEGDISDNELNKCLVNPLVPGVILHAVFDCCHSGTNMDLQYVTHVNEDEMFVWKGERMGGIYKGTAGGTVVQFAACHDHQCTTDTGSYGIAAYSFIQAIERGGVRQSYASVLSQMRGAIRSYEEGDGAVDGGGEEEDEEGENGVDGEEEEEEEDEDEWEDEEGSEEEEEEEDEDDEDDATCTRPDSISDEQIPVLSCNMAIDLHRTILVL